MGRLAHRSLATFLLSVSVLLSADVAIAQGTAQCTLTQPETGLIPLETACALERAGWGIKTFDEQTQQNIVIDAAGNEIDVLAGQFLILSNMSQMEQTIYDLIPGPKSVSAVDRPWDLLAVMLGDRSDERAVRAIENAGIVLPEVVASFIPAQAPPSGQAIEDSLTDLLAGNETVLDQSSLISALYLANSFTNGCGITPKEPLRDILGAFNAASLAGLPAFRGYGSQAQEAFSITDRYGFPPCRNNGVTYLNALSDSIFQTFRQMAETTFMKSCTATNRVTQCQCAFVSLSLYQDNLVDTALGAAVSKLGGGEDRLIRSAASSCR